MLERNLVFNSKIEGNCQFLAFVEEGVLSNLAKLLKILINNNINNIFTSILIIISTYFFSFHSNAQLEIHRLTDNVYIYTTYNNFQGTPFPSNSLYILSPNGAILIDTPWDESQTLPLLDSIRSRHKMEVIASISTHFHDDRTAGIDILRQQGIATYTSHQTRELCIQRGEKIAEFAFLNDTTFQFGSIRIETFYPGSGHSEDNIVVYLPSEKVLFGGCLVKSFESKGLGNLADADIENWSSSIIRVKRKYKRAKFVVPGHMDWTNRNSLKHTLKLLKQYRL